VTSSRFAIVGGGWRAAFCRRVVAALPERFEVSGPFTRDVARRSALGSRLAVAMPAAAQDHLHGWCVEEAPRTGRRVTTAGHLWDEAAA
jgi:hypothetical protein